MPKYKIYKYSKEWIDVKLRKQIMDVKENKESFRAASRKYADKMELMKWQIKKGR